MRTKITTIRNWNAINTCFTKPLEKLHKDILNIQTEKDFEQVVQLFDSIVEECNNDLLPTIRKKFPYVKSSASYLTLTEYLKENKPKTHLYEHLKMQIQDTKEQKKVYNIQFQSGAKGSFTTETIIIHFNSIIDKLNGLIHAFYNLN